MLVNELKFHKGRVWEVWGKVEDGMGEGFRGIWRWALGRGLMGISYKNREERKVNVISTVLGYEWALGLVASGLLTPVR